jgi:hypothetical protein
VSDTLIARQDSYRFSPVTFFHVSSTAQSVSRRSPLRSSVSPRAGSGSGWMLAFFGRCMPPATMIRRRSPDDQSP